MRLRGAGPSPSSCPAWCGRGSSAVRQCGQRRRTSRCATKQRHAAATRYRGTPISTRRLTAAEASLVCSVLNTRWPVMAASAAILAVSRSRISPTMITSGSARTSERSAWAKVRPMARLDLGLDDALDLALDGVLDRVDLALGRLDELERGVQRGGLARAGGPDDDDAALRGLERRLEALEVVADEAERGERGRERRDLQDADGDVLAVQAGDGGEAQVDGLAAGELEAWCGRPAGSRRSAMFEVAHDLEAADDAGLQLMGNSRRSCSTPSMRQRTCSVSSRGSRWMSDASMLTASVSTPSTISMVSASISPLPADGSSPSSRASLSLPRELK